MNTAIRTLWTAVAILALYNEAKRAGLIRWLSIRSNFFLKRMKPIH